MRELPTLETALATSSACVCTVCTLLNRRDAGVRDALAKLVYHLMVTENPQTQQQGHSHSSRREV
jgi:hypothetical protein